MKTLILPFLFLAMTFISCLENSQDENLEKKVNAVDLYIAGAENNQACYWKNGQKTILSNGTGLYASQIIVENNNIYVFGAMTSEYLPDLPSKHYYLWKNNVRYNLDEYLQDVPDPGPNAYFAISNKMIVHNGDVYFCGYVKNSNPLPGQGANSYYFWKNGLKTLITDSNEVSFSGGYNFIDGEIYLGLRRNYQYNPVSWQTGFYKNNTYIPLTTDSHILNFLKDPNNDIYVYFKNIFTNQKYLKNIQNNTFVNLPPNPPGEIIDIVFADNDRYFVGDNFYYKNNTLVILNDPNGFNKIRSFNVKNQEIYTIRYKDVGSAVPLAKVFINNVEVMSQPITAVSVPDVGGLLSIFID